MSFAVFRSMLLSLVRDRAALAMSFLLPALFFLIFADRNLVCIVYANIGRLQNRITKKTVTI